MDENRSYKIFYNNESFLKDPSIRHANTIAPFYP